MRTYRHYRDFAPEEFAELERLWPFTPNRVLSERFNLSQHMLAVILPQKFGWRKDRRARYRNVMQKLIPARAALIARDKRRKELGLQPLHRIVKPDSYTNKQARLRSYAKLYFGYVVSEGSASSGHPDKFTIFYDSGTRRYARLEERLRRHGLLVRPWDGD